MAQWDTYRVSLVGTYDGVNTVNSFYFQETVTGGGGDGPMPALWDSLASFRAAYVACLNNAWTATCGTIRRLSPGVTESFSFSFTDSGTVAGDGFTPLNYGLLCYWAIPHNSKNSNHVKMPAVSEIMAEAGQFTTAANSLYVAFGTEWVAPRTQDGYTFIPIRSRKPSDVITQPLPQVLRTQLDPRVRNTRGRSIYECTG